MYIIDKVRTKKASIYCCYAKENSNSNGRIKMKEHSDKQTSTLENKRTTGFLLGLILVLAILFVAFEYNSAPQDAEMSDDDLDELTQDIDLHPAVNDKDMVALGAPQQSSKSLTENIKAASNIPLKDQIERLAPHSNSPLLIGNGEAQALNAKVSDALPPVPLAIQSPEKVRIVQQMPEFPGGGSAFMQWLSHQLRYPPVALSQKIQGKVVVSFIVNKDGSIAEIKLEKSVNPYLDREALRVIRSMPRWTPGIENNKPCKTMVAVPIVFNL